jgi:hypothetical protein
MTTHRQRTVRDAIELVLSQQTRWLETAAVAELVRPHIDSIDAAFFTTSTREIREKLQTLWRDGKVHRTRDGRGYSWRWRP